MFALLALSLALAAAPAPAATKAALTADEASFVSGLVEFYDALCDARAHASSRLEDKQRLEAADEFRQIAAKATELEQQVTHGQTLPVWSKPIAFPTRDGAFDAKTFPAAVRAFHDDMLEREKSARAPPAVSAAPTATAAPGATPESEIVFLNVKTKKFHCASCSSAQKCTKNCAYVERSKAVAMGGVACRLCNGTCR